MKKFLTITTAVVCFLFALGIIVYPALSSYVNELYRSEIQTTYEEQLNQADDTALREAKEQAIAYNESITPGYSQEAIAAATEDYDSQLNLADNGIMGYVEVPKIGVYLPIYHGTDSDSLERGVGHLLGSSLPVGGESTHTILSGHSGMASQRLFTDLAELEIGDVFYLHVLDKVLAYQVDAINTVLPYDTSLLGITQGEDYCTLVTCAPIGVNTHRLLVRGSRVPCEAAQEVQAVAESNSEETPSSWEEQYMLGILLGVLAAVVIVVIVGLVRLIRKRRKGGLSLRNER